MAPEISARMSKTVDSVLSSFPAPGKPLPPGLLEIDLSIAENKLLRPELVQLCKDAVTESLNSEVMGVPTRMLNYPPGFGGELALKASLSTFFNTYFNPANPIAPENVVVGAGAGNCLDALMCTICEAGDSVLVPSSYFPGFGPHFLKHAGVGVIAAQVSMQDALTPALIPALRSAYANAEDPSKIKALVITNAHNPLSACYPAEVLRECVEFCKSKGIHYISDEVYALSQFSDKGTPFVSALSLNLPEEERSRVHVVYSASKDFGCAGIRMGCIVSQNKRLLMGTSMATFYQVSSLSSLFLQHIQKSAELPSLLEIGRKRLAYAYQFLSSALQELGIEFFPATTGLFLFAKIAGNASTWEEEASAVEKLKQVGVKVSPGRTFKGVDAEKGWARVTFAVTEDELKEAVARIKKCYG